MSKPLRILFAGTPEFAALHLQALIDSPHQVVGVYTQPDRPAGRGKKLTASPVKLLAQEHQIAVEQPASLKDSDAQQQLASYDADIMVVVAYGLILPQPVLNTPRLGCINVHGSLLPRWRGAAPIQRAIWAGDAATGVTIMQMDIGLDTGDMLLKTHCPIAADDTSASLYQKLALQGPPALLEALEGLANGTLAAEAQDDTLATYAEKLNKTEANIDWRQPAEVIERRIRAFTPWPGSQFTIKDALVKVHGAQWLNSAAAGPAGTIAQLDKRGVVVNCGQQQLKLTQLQLPGKKANSAYDVANARPDWFKPGIQLTLSDSAHG